MASFLKVRLIHSAIAKQQRQKDTLRGLGLRRINQVRILKDTPAIRGMVHKVIHLVQVEETPSAKVSVSPKLATYRLSPKGTSKKKETKSVKKDQEKASAPKAKAISPEAKAKTENCSKAPPEKRLKISKTVP